MIPYSSARYHTVKLTMQKFSITVFLTTKTSPETYKIKYVYPYTFSLHVSVG